MLRKEKRPWDIKGHKKQVSLRFPPRAVAQLCYIAERTERTKQRVVDRILLPALEHQAEELWIGE